MFSCEYCEVFKNTYFEEHLPTAASVQSNIVSDKKTKKKYIQANVLHKFISHFWYKACSSKHRNSQMEQFSILLIKNLKSKNNLPKVFRSDLIFQIASSNDHVTITNLRNVRPNNFE